MNIKNKSEELKDEVINRIQENPIKSVSIALSVGLGLGVILGLLIKK